MNIDIQELKRLLRLPQLMEKLGYGDRAKSSARCMFHNDNHPSFGIFSREGKWGFRCHSCGAKGDEVTFVEKALNLSRGDAIRRFAELAGVTDKTQYHSTKSSRLHAETPNSVDVDVSELPVAPAPYVTAVAKRSCRQALFSLVVKKWT